MLLQKMFMQKVATQRTKPSSLVRQPEFAATSIDLQFFLHLEELCPWRLSHTELLNIRVVPSIHSIINVAFLHGVYRVVCLQQTLQLAFSPFGCLLKWLSWSWMAVSIFGNGQQTRLMRWKERLFDFCFCCLIVCWKEWRFFRRIEEDMFDFNLLQGKCH